MSNVEEDIKRCEKLTEPQNANWIGITNQLAIAHLIEKVKELRAMCEEYCPKTERIKELEEENRIFALEGSRAALKLHIEENYKNLIADVSGIAKELGLEEDGTIDEIYTKIKEKDKQIEKKDKIIDLMAERIEWLCKSNGILLDKEHDENCTQEDIKKYFERKVKNEL